MSERMTLRTKVLYASGDTAIAVQMVILGLYLLFFYNSVLKVPATLAGAATAIGLVWDAIIDPLIGDRSDRSRSRLGRRHGLMLVGALALGPSFWLLLAPPRSLGTAGLFVWLVGTMLLFRLASALYRIPYLSLGAELSTDYNERTSIVGLRALFAFGSTMAAASLSFALFFPSTGGGPDPKLDYARYPAMGLAFGTMMTVSALLAFAGTFRYRTRAASAPIGSGTTDRSLFGRFRETLSNRAFRQVWLSFVLFFLSVIVNATTSIHYFTWYVGISSSRSLAAIQASFYVGAVAGACAWMRLARHGEKHQLCRVAMLGTAALMAMSFVLVGEGRVFGSGDARPLIVGNMLAGAFASALWILPAAMVPDIADQEELAGGARREGLFFGMLIFGEKIAAAGSLLIGGVLLDYFVNFRPGEPLVGSAVTRLGILYGVVPAVVMATGALVLRGYQLDRATVGETRRRLGDRAAAATDHRQAAGGGAGDVPVDAFGRSALD